MISDLQAWPSHSFTIFPTYLTLETTTLCWSFLRLVLFAQPSVHLQLTSVKTCAIMTFNQCPVPHFDPNWIEATKPLLHSRNHHLQTTEDWKKISDDLLFASKPVLPSYNFGLARLGLILVTQLGTCQTPSRPSSRLLAQCSTLIQIDLKQTRLFSIARTTINEPLNHLCHHDLHYQPVSSATLSS